MKGGFIDFLQRASAALSARTPWIAIAVAVFAARFPRSFAWVEGDTQTALLGLIMLTMGLTLSADDFRALARRPLQIAIGAVAQYSLMPLIAFALSRIPGMPRGIAVGLVLVGCCPGGVSSNIMSYLCRGDVAFSVGMTSVTTLLAPVVTPLLMRLLAGELVDIDAPGMFRSVLMVTLLPVALGFAINRAFARGRTAAAFSATMKVLPGFAVLALLCIVGGVASAHGRHFAESGAAVFAAVFIHNALGYATGYATGVVARFDRARRRTVAIEVGMQNAGLATVLATRHFPALPEAAIASAVSCVWHSISGALLAEAFNAADRRAARKSEGT